MHLAGANQVQDVILTSWMSSPCSQETGWSNDSWLLIEGKG